MSYPDIPAIAPKDPDEFVVWCLERRRLYTEGNIKVDKPRSEDIFQARDDKPAEADT